MARYDVKHSPQRVRDEQAAQRQAAPPPLQTPEEPLVRAPEAGTSAS